jgi:hypothetical protein
MLGNAPFTSPLNTVVLRVLKILIPPAAVAHTRPSSKHRATPHRKSPTHSPPSSLYRQPGPRQAKCRAGRSARGVGGFLDVLGGGTCSGIAAITTGIVIIKTYTHVHKSETFGYILKCGNLGIYSKMVVINNSREARWLHESKYLWNVLTCPFVWHAESSTTSAV